MSSAAIRLPEFERYRDIRQVTLKSVQDVTQAQSEFSSRPGGWSAGEILDHLLKSQLLYQTQFEKLAAMSRSGQRPVLYLDHDDIDFSLPLIPKAMMPLLAAPLAVMNAFVPSAIRETLIRNQVLPAKNPRAAQPRGGRPIEDLRKELRDSMDSLGHFFVSNTDLPFDSMRVCHPALGNNNVPALLRIVAAHEERHQDQLVTLFHAPSFPKAAKSRQSSAA